MDNPDWYKDEELEETGCHLLDVPKYSEWYCEMFYGHRYQPSEGKHPNWFWRKMQYLVLGFKWKKREWK